MNTIAYRLPEVAVGENRYLPLDPSYDDGSLLGFLRMAASGRVDLADGITNPAQYLGDVKWHARMLEAGGYLLGSDADAIILRAKQKFPTAGW